MGGRPPKERTGKRRRPSAAILKKKGRMLRNKNEDGIVWKADADDEEDAEESGAMEEDVDTAVDEDASTCRNEDTDPDDNPGDADASGDRSVYVDTPFIEFNGNENHEDSVASKNQASDKDVQKEPFKIEWKDVVRTSNFLRALEYNLFLISG